MADSELLSEINTLLYGLHSKTISLNQFATFQSQKTSSQSLDLRLLLNV